MEKRVKTLDKQAVRQMVRRVVYRTLGMPPGAISAKSRPLVTEQDVQKVPTGGRLVVPRGVLVTPLARQAALEQKITLEEEATAPRTTPAGTRRPTPKTVAIGADHGGYELKELLKGHLNELGYQFVDCGTSSQDPVDYPDLAFAVARLVAQQSAWRGIIVDGAGIGSCMAANKVPGVRAAMCYDLATAVNSREHNDANVLTLGAGMIGPNLAKQIVKSWLETPVGAERHTRRVKKIMEIERRYLKEPPANRET